MRAFWESLGRHHQRASTADSNDRRGFKNAYIALLRDHHVLHQLMHVPKGATLVDFGCGEGGLTRILARSGYSAIGLDIAVSLLRLATRSGTEGLAIYVQCDGRILPLASHSSHAVVVYEVMMYLDDTRLAGVLGEVKRVLRPDGVLIMIEQCRSQTRHVDLHQKTQRSRDAWSKALVSAGFEISSMEICRHGHFPLTYLIRYGLWPLRWWQFAMALEHGVGRLLGILPGDYADVLFVAQPRGLTGEITAV